MSFVFSPEQEMLRDTVRRFIADKMPMSRVRHVMEIDTGIDLDAWSELADLGMLGVHIPEEFGGAGFTFRELGLVMEELGRALSPVPYLSSVVLGAGALLLAGTENQKREMLPAIAAGELRLALAVTESDGDWDISNTHTTVRGKGTKVISGSKAYVIDGHTADVLVVSARQEDDRIVMCLVPADAAGVASKRVETLDMTRRLAEVTFDEVEVSAEALLGDNDTAACLAKLLDIAAAALAAEQVGGAQACLEASVEYAKVRYQFGRPIGSFQAIKHKCADMLVQVESAKSAAYHAASVAADDPTEFLIAAPLAKSVCSDAYFSVAADNIQVHGGIGFTWEHDAHLYFKRAKSTQLLFGTPLMWRKVLAERIGV